MERFFLENVTLAVPVLEEAYFEEGWCRLDAEEFRNGGGHLPLGKTTYEGVFLS